MAHIVRKLTNGDSTSETRLLNFDAARAVSQFRPTIDLMSRVLMIPRSSDNEGNTQSNLNYTIHAHTENRQSRS